MSQQLHVLIGGGTGLIGRALANNLRNKGHKVTIVSRRGKRPEIISWRDIEKHGLPDSTDAVVNLSGLPAFNVLRRWNDAYKNEIYESRVEMTKIFRNAIINAEAKPSVFVVGTAIGLYPPSLTEVYTEDGRVGNDFFAKLVTDWEAAGKLPEDVEKDVRQVSVRTGLVLSTEGGMFKDLLPQFKLGVGGSIGSGNQFVPWIHIDDIAGIFVHAIENSSVNGILNGVAPNTIKYSQFAKDVAQTLNRPAFFWVPSFLMNTILGSERGAHLLLGQNVKPERVLNSGYKFIFSEFKPAVEDLLKG